MSAVRCFAARWAANMNVKVVKYVDTESRGGLFLTNFSA